MMTQSFRIDLLVGNSTFCQVSRPCQSMLKMVRWEPKWGSGSNNIFVFYARKAKLTSILGRYVVAQGTTLFRRGHYSKVEVESQKAQQVCGQENAFVQTSTMMRLGQRGTKDSTTSSPCYPFGHRIGCVGGSFSGRQSSGRVVVTRCIFLETITSAVWQLYNSISW
jgi:hypothetical protein